MQEALYINVSSGDSKLSREIESIIENVNWLMINVESPTFSTHLSNLKSKMSSLKATGSTAHYVQNEINRAKEYLDKLINSLVQDNTYIISSLEKNIEENKKYTKLDSIIGDKSTIDIYDKIVTNLSSELTQDNINYLKSIRSEVVKNTDSSKVIDYDKMHEDYKSNYENYANVYINRIDIMIEEIKLLKYVEIDNEDNNGQENQEGLYISIPKQIESINKEKSFESNVFTILDHVELNNLEYVQGSEYKYKVKDKDAKIVIPIDIQTKSFIKSEGIGKSSTYKINAKINITVYGIQSEDDYKLIYEVKDWIKK